MPLAAQGTNRKKALVLISDGNDTSSNTPLVEVRQLIHESDVLLYAVGIDSDDLPSISSPRTKQPPVPSRRFAPTRRIVPRATGPAAVPAALAVQAGYLGIRYVPAGQTAQPRITTATDHVNVAARRDLTDDSGGQCLGRSSATAARSRIRRPRALPTS